MKELVEVIAKALVDNPDEVVVTETEKESGTFIELKVAPSPVRTARDLRGSSCAAGGGEKF